MNVTELRLLGLLPSGAVDATHVTSALESLGGLLRGGDARGLLNRSLAPTSWVLAGTAFDEPGREPIEVSVAAGLERARRVLGQARTDELGRFKLELQATRAPTVDVTFSRGAVELGSVKGVQVEAETWVEWGVAPQPGRFEVQRSLLALANATRASVPVLTADDSARHREADALATSLGISPAAAWALLLEKGSREGLATLLPADAVKVVVAAAERREVASTSVQPASLEQLRTAMRGERHRAWKDSRPNPKARGTWGELLEAVGAPSAAVRDDDFDGPPEFEARLRTDLPALSLAPLVEHEPAALKLLSGAGLKSAADELSRRSPQTLAEVLRPLGQPSVDAFARQLENADPGKAVMWRLRRKLGPGVEPLFAKATVDLTTLTPALWGDKAEVDAATTAELMRTQRLLHVAKTPAATETLLAEGFGSAQDIALEDREVIVARLAPKLEGGAAEARTLWDRAALRYRAATELYVRTRTPEVLDGSVARSASAELRLAMQIPTLRELFGPQDTCACQNCESVVGQPAYLVDLLMWLDRAGLDAGTAYQALVQRRLDLTHLLLSCANAETPLPYIDLVCELLEQRAAPLLQLVLTHDSRKRQTVVSAEELRAAPQFLDVRVYDRLSTATTPGLWPIDLVGAEAGALLAETQLELADVLDAFGAPHAAALASLSLSATHAAVLATPNPGAQAAVWGKPLAQVTAEELMRRGTVFLGRALEWRALEEAVGTRFVARGDALSWALLPDATGATFDACKASQRIIAGLADAHLDRLHRFLSLARALPSWSFQELDEVLALLGTQVGGQVVLDAATLDALALLTRVMAKARISVGEALVWQRPFTTTGPRGAVLRAVLGATPLSAGTLSAKRSWLAAVLAQPEPVIDALIAAVSAPATALDLTSFATLFRYVRLAESLGVDVPTVLARARFGVDPFADASTTLAFLEEHARLDGASAVQLDAVRVGRVDAAPAALAAGLSALNDRYPQVAGETSAQRLDRILAGPLWLEPLQAWLGVARGAEQQLALEKARVELRAELLALFAWAALGGGATPLPAQALERVGRLGAVLAAWPRSASVPSLFPLVKAATAVNLSALLRELTVATGDWEPLRASLGSPPSAAVSAIASALELSVDDVSVAATFAPAPSTSEQWVGLRRRLELLQRSALPAAALRALAVKLEASSVATLRDAVRSATPRAVWLTRSANVQKQLRPLRRDALVQYLVCVEKISASDLSDELLLDVEMGACRDTTRLSAACTAIQTFVNRVFLGLEGNRSATTESTWSQWAWRKRYSLWKGNRLIFLFPENFLSATQRSLSTSQFQKLKAVLARGAVNETSVGQALVTYLEELAEFSDLEFLALGSDYVPDPDDYEHTQPRALATVGRTRGSSARYFFTRFVGGRWYPFEELQLGYDPKHLALHTSSNQSILMWPRSTLMARPYPVTASPEKEVRPEMLLALRYGWTVRDADGSWSAPRMTSGANLFRSRGLNEGSLVLQPIASGGDLLPGEVRVSTWWPGSGTSLIAAMYLRRDTTRRLAFADENAPATHWVRGKRDELPTTTVLLDDPTQWSGPDPAEELRVHHAGTEVRAPAAGKIVPWSKLTFSQNRMLSVPQLAGQPGRAIPLTTDTGKIVISKPASPYSVSGLTWRRRGTTNPEYSPSSWAFMVSGVSWAFFMAQADSNGFKKDALGLGPSTFNGKAYAAAPAYHPFTHGLLNRLREQGMQKLFERKLQRKPGAVLGVPARQFAADLGLNAQEVNVPSSTAAPAVEETLDFHELATYGRYNWEIFFHAPILAATLLRGAGLHAEAQRFFHYVFNPLEAFDPAALGARWWVTAAFDDQAQALKSLEQILRDGLTSALPFLSVETNPFDPHAVAESRRSAYQRFTVLEYVRNLLDWGDALYRRAGVEDLDEAAQLYGLAGRILGERPLQLDALGKRPTRAFESPGTWKGGGNVLVSIENLVPALEPGESPPTPPAVVHLPLQRDPGQRLYFGVPRNDRLLSFWDRHESAVKNLRTCKALDGSTLTLDAVLSGDLDLSALVSAAAAGSGALQQALSLTGSAKSGVRFNVLAARALELAGDARALGQAVLSATERHDTEELAGLRVTWEDRVLERQQAARKAQVTAAEKERDALAGARALATSRRDFNRDRPRRSEGEETAFGLSIGAAVGAAVSSVLDLAAGGASSVPDVTLGVAGMMGSPVSTVTLGGTNFGGGISAFAKAASAVAGLLDRSSTMVATQAGYDRRTEEWDHAVTQAQLELDHLNLQAKAAEVRVQVAKAELRSVDEQRATNALQADFLTSRFTNVELYDWLLAELSRVHRQCFELAMETARNACSAYAAEVGSRAPAADLSGVKWTAERRGLVAAEELTLALRRIMADHLSNSVPPAIVTRRFSLQQLAPRQLIALRAGSTVTFTVPGWWVRRLDPGLTARRVRTVAVSLPCVGGASASVNGTLKLAVPGASPAIGEITLSTGIDDFGFDLSLRGEHYLPFEGVALDEGITFTFSLPAAAEIDRSTIADLVLRVEFGAERGTTPGGETPAAAWPSALELRRDAPDVWNSLRTTGRATLALDDLTPALVDAFKVAGPVQVVGLDEALRADLSAQLQGNAVTLSVVGALVDQPAVLKWSLTAP